MGKARVAKTLTNGVITHQARPREFDRAAACKLIFDRFMATDMGLHKILAEREHHLPSVVTFWQWLHDDDAAGAPLQLSAGYARAKRIQAEFMESQLLELADRAPLMTERGVDSGDVRHTELRLNTRKWLMGRLDSKRYGDRQTLAGDNESPLTGKRQDLSNLTDEELSLLVALQAKIES